jgi:hypothetical protein
MAGSQNTDVTDEELNGLSDEERAAIQDTEGSDEAANLEAVIGDDDDDDAAAQAEAEAAAKAQAEAEAEAKEAAGGEGEDAAAAEAAAAAAGDEGAAGDDDDMAGDLVTELAVVPVENYDEKMAAFKEQKAELRKKLDDGDLDLTQYEEQKDAIVQQETELLIKQNAAISAAQQNQHMAIRQWEREQKHFFSKEENKIYEDKYIGAALNQAVKDLANDPKHADKPGLFFLQEADRIIREKFGKPAPAKINKDEGKGKDKGGRKPDLSGVPKTLGGIPAAETTDTAAEFAHLEGLNGIELEAALARMPKEQADRYLRS